MAGNVSQYTGAAVTAVSGSPVPLCIGHDVDGFYAMTLTCTHAGCTVGVCDTSAARAQPDTGAASGCGDTASNAPPLQCPCHGSRFDANGSVVGGPAPAPLNHFEVSFDASQNIIVDTDAIVSASMRYPPM